MASFLIKAGLWILAASVAVVLLAELVLPQLGEKAGGWAKLGLVVGAGMFGVGLVLSLMTRGASALFQRRCVRCKKPVARGATYCQDHLKQSVEQARDKAHHERGSGL